MQFRAEIRVAFSSARQAEIAYNSLRVDREPDSRRSTRSISLHDTTLVASVSRGKRRPQCSALRGQFQTESTTQGIFRGRDRAGVRAAVQ